MTPDWSAAPEAVPYADLSDPQTLNLYAYAENNPVTRTDADGHTPIDGTWMQTGHMMQEVGFAFHLWDGQAEDQARVQPPRALASGPAAALPMLLQGAGTEVTVTSAAPAALDPATLLAFDGMLLIQDAGQFYQLGEAYGWWHGPTVLPPPVLQAAKAKSEAKDGAQDKKLTPGEIELIQSSGHDIHEIKEENGGRPPSRFDLYKDPDGNIDVRPKNSGKRGEPTGLNINDLKG